MQNPLLNKITIILCALFITTTVSAQDKPKTDTIKAKESDRNVMLNASNSTGPREVNIGLPASVGGTTIFENGLPVVYFFFPELPTKAWRNDATINRAKLYDLSQTAYYAGEVGFSLNTFDNLGTDQFKGNGSLSSNVFGLIRSDINLSGPIGKKGWKYSLGGYVNFDPGTFKADGLPTFYNDKTQLYKVGITKDYNSDLGKGSITLFYKYVNTANISPLFSPFVYGKGGKVSEYDGFKIGRDSYLLNNQSITLRDGYTGEFKTNNILDDYKTTSSTVDLLWNHKLNNGIKLSFNNRFRSSESGAYTPVMTYVAPGNNDYTYLDGTPYQGRYIQGVLILATRRTPIKTLLSTFEVSKKSGKHDWTVGANNWNYDVDKYATESSSYVQEVAPNPSILIRNGAAAPQNGMANFNAPIEYNDGTQNKLAVFAFDKWTATSIVELNMGARLEYQTLRGYYIKTEDRTGPTPFNAPKTDIKNDWLNKTISVNAVFKVAQKSGLLADVMYTEQGGILGNYNVGVDPKIKQSIIPVFAAGVYYNHPFFSVVSKGTYVSRSNNRTNVNFTHPTSGLATRSLETYSIETIGWTTDVLAKLPKGFDLHFLLTIQSPRYKKYDGTITFRDGSTRDFDFNNKYVNGISNVLMEIDPSYTYKKLRVWASARYFSKQYANLPNTLTFAGRWETFIGTNYKFNKNVSLGVNVINILNQRGASGAIAGTDLLTADEAKRVEGTILAGSYIRPFTVETTLKYNF